ncbi:MAG: formylglycine-generating enzyme family protein [Chloroflexota bacterium]
MPSPFDITVATNTVNLDNNRIGVAAFTVKNITRRHIRASAKVTTQPPAGAAWVTVLPVEGSTEAPSVRDFPVDSTQQIQVKIAVPTNAPLGSYTLQMIVADDTNPDDNFVASPDVVFTVAKPPPSNGKPFPLWIIPAVLIGIVVIAGMVFVSRPKPLALPTPTVTSASTTTPKEVEMVLVPKGCFSMGNASDASIGDGGQQCFEASFWIDKTEVTQGDFQRLGGQQVTPSQFSGDRQPVENVTWFEARDFCVKRGARLPTEREWEYAARGPNSLIYPWGPDWKTDNVVWDSNANKQTADVGSRPEGASWVGALDMAGNVWEWTNSLEKPYPYNAGDGREDPNNNTDTRALRGGAWNYSNPNYFRASFRNLNPPDVAHNDLGFRCARSG